ncbi:MAG: tetratricopeptide repeat protein [Balneolaceae bacterium]|jgi:tetratricopeptide (TPR) repeat protein
MIESFNKKELEEKIDQYIHGQLSPKETDELWSELIQDGYHLDYLKTVANLKAVVKRRKEKVKARKQRKYWYYAAAAVVTLFIAVLAVMNISTQNKASTIKPVSSIELDYYRSAEGGLSDGNESKVIQNAIRLANTGKVNEAITLLDKELHDASTPSWISKLNLNIGSLYYNQGKYDEAISFYKKVISYKDKIDVLTLEKAYWYVGNAYFHLDQLAKARENIKNAYELNGAYRRVAKSYLNALS